MTEVYVSLDGIRYEKLDTEDVAQLNMKYIKKDLQDIAKVFSPFSQDFAFKATPGNQKKLGFFGDTSVIRPQTENKYLCKIYTNGILNLTGILKVKTGRYKNNELQTFNASFGTFMTNLKDRVGNDTLNDLGAALVNYRASDIRGLMQSGASITDAEISIKYFIPFMSNNRVWTYDEDVDGEAKDNIYYSSGITIGSDRYINETELRPAIALTSLLAFIKRKYALDIVAPIESRNEVKDAYILCNNSKFTNAQWWTYHKPNNLIPLYTGGMINGDEYDETPKYELTSNNSNDSFRVKMNYDSGPNNSHYRNSCTFMFNIDLLTNGIEQSGRFRLRKISDNTILHYEEFTTANGGKKQFKKSFSNTQLSAGPIDFVVEFQMDSYCRFDSVEVRLAQFVNIPGGFGETILGTLYHRAEHNYPSGVGGLSTYNRFQVDLIAALPNTSVLDFITSYLKTFNVRIYDTSPNDNRLFWLSPFDINTTGLEYSKATPDYTEFLDSKEYTKDAVDKYNYYNFRHAESEYKSNVDYKKAAGLFYGQAAYPTLPPTNPTEYKVETKWSIIPPVFVDNSTRLLTAYGFNSDAPIFTESENFRYTPNLDELTILYKPAQVQIMVTASVFGTDIEFGHASVLSCDVNGVPSVVKLSYCLPPMPVNSSGNSLGFSVLVIDDTQYPDSLYERCYSEEIERLLDQNCLVHNFTFTLPSDEVYLNEYTSVQGTGNTPSGFRLQNDIIVGETRFSIEDATIDITTGKLVGKFLNYR